MPKLTAEELAAIRARVGQAMYRGSAENDRAALLAHVAALEAEMAKTRVDAAGWERKYWDAVEVALTPDAP